MQPLSFMRGREPELEWIGGRYIFPEPVREGGVVIQPEIVLWLELPSGLLVGSMMIDPRQPVSLAATLEATMAQPAKGPPRRPARIRVANARLAKELRGLGDGIHVFVAPVPELDETFAELTTALTESRPEPSYLGDGSIPPAAVAELFAAAGEFFRAAPWRHVFDQQIVRIDVPAYGVDGGCLSVIGAAGESFGLLLFRSVEDFEAFASPTPRSSDGQTAMRSLSFDRKIEIPPSMLREIKQHRWPVAGARAYPALFAIDAEMQTVSLFERDLRLMTASTRAFLSFFAVHRDVFEDDEPTPVQASFLGEDGVSVTITAPYVDAAL